MYIPNYYQMTERDEIISFMKRYSFGAIISAIDNYPLATHLPFVVEERGEDIFLTGHFAKANDQWKLVAPDPVLVIFSEPHAYISPRHYEKELNVPTWNYVAVHAYGEGSLISETSQAFDVLEKTISTYEEEYRQQWERLPVDYKLKMLKGIVAFEIKVTDIQAKKKLSQNKLEAERMRIMKFLSSSGFETERQIGEYMQLEENKLK